MLTKIDAKNALDKIISKSRVHLYKPIQIAEILYKIRTEKNINPLNLEEYRNESKHWRDEMTIQLLGRKCTSSARFQDDLFNENAIPPTILKILSDENLKTSGAVEAYIYKKFTWKHNQLANALNYCKESTKENFNVEKFINSFWNEPGLKRSLDKIYEIVVYALFSALSEMLQIKIEISIEEKNFSAGIFNFDKISVICGITHDRKIFMTIHIYFFAVLSDNYRKCGKIFRVKNYSPLLPVG